MLAREHRADLGLADGAALDLGAVLARVGVAVVAKVEVRAADAAVGVLAAGLGEARRVVAGGGGGLRAGAAAGAADEGAELRRVGI